MSRKTLYVIEPLVYAGRAFERSDVIALDSATEQQLLEEDRVSTTEPKATAAADADPVAAAPSIAEISTEDLVAELETRDDYEAPAPTPAGPFDYSKLKVDQLQGLIEARVAALEVKGTGKDGDVVKDDLVRTLTEADAALTS